MGFIAIGLDKIKVHQPKILKDLILKKLKSSVAIYEDDLGVDEKRANEGY